jgi:hypothetical protein
VACHPDAFSHGNRLMRPQPPDPSFAQGEQLWSYWQRELAGVGLVPALNLPTDRPRPAVQTFTGDIATFSIPTDVAKRLSSIARAEGITLYSVLLSSWMVLLHRYTGQDDILVSTNILRTDGS